MFIAFGLFLALFFYRKYTLANTELTLANQRILDRDRIIYNNQKQLDALKIKKTGEAGATQPAPENTGLTTLSPEELISLREKGLTNPEVTLRDDLISKQDILLPKGTLGGTMAIREIRILNDRYALAYYEDGHNGGHLLLRFTVEPDKRINWKVLDRYQ